jgi:hypothetical protein
MGRQSKIKKLPRPVREELDRRLVEQGFAGYRGLEAWLFARGYQITKSALQRYGANFESSLAGIKLATEQAKAIISASPDDEATVNDALVRLVQSKLHNLLIEVDLDEPNLARIARAVADLGRATIGQKKWAQEMRERLDKEKTTAAEKIGAVTKAAGLSDEAEAKIRAALFGINPMRPMSHDTATAIRQAVLDISPE